MAGDGPLSGDFRDWKLIRDWALEIAEELTGATVTYPEVDHTPGAATAGADS